MPWPIMTDQIHLDSEKDAANAFLKHKGLRTIKSITFVDDEDDSYIRVNTDDYCISWREEPMECRNIKGTYITQIPYLCAWYTEEPSDPTEDGGVIPLYEESHFGCLSYFLVRVELERVFREWINFRR